MSKEAMKHALEVAEGIVSSDWRKWRELASPAEFERWAKQRAYHVATILRKALAELPAQKRPQNCGTSYCSCIECVMESAQQNPVAAAWDEGYRQGVEDERTSEENIGIAGFGAKVEPARQNPYGTTPPQRTWVDLTKEEVDSWELPDCPTVFEFVQFIEDKIKEKNT